MTGHPLRGITFGNSTYVVVGRSGTVLTSTDSISWTLRSNVTTEFLCGVSYLNGKFIAVGKNGSLLTSTDGITWDNKTSGISTDLKEISYGNGVYVAVGNDGTIISSADTETWTSRDGASGIVTAHGERHARNSASHGALRHGKFARVLCQPAVAKCDRLITSGRGKFDHKITRRLGVTALVDERSVLFLLLYDLYLHALRLIF